MWNSRSILVTSFLICALLIQAQPYKFGCHYFRNGGQHIHQPRPLTAEERDGIDDVIARSDTFDILHYEIAIDVTDYAGRTIRAATTIRFVPLLSSPSITFDLRELLVDSVTTSNSALAFTQADDLLNITLVDAVIGDTSELTVHYHGEPVRDPDWGGFYFQNNYIYNLGIGLSTIPPNFGKVWYPCFDSFVERASYTYHVKSAGTFRAHCQGEFLGEIALGGDTVIRSYTLDQSIPTHVSAIAVADFRDSTTIHTGAYGDIPITLTGKPAQINAMVDRFVSLGDAIDAYEFWYGPYPYDRVGYVMATDGALEIPENVAYPDFMNSQSLFDNRGLFGHELGHHWWGDAVTPRTHNDMWFKEGPAEYSGHLLEEWAFGEEAFVDVVKDNHLYVLEQAHLQDGGFQALSPMPDPYIYGLHTYYKGASVLHNLRGYLGDTLFRQAMHAVQLAHANSTLDATGFKDALEVATGADLDPFFDAWIFSPGFSVFVVDAMDVEANGPTWTVNLNLRQRLRAAADMHLQVPLDITLIGAQRQVQEFQVTANGEVTSHTLTCDFEPVMAVVNGHNRLNQARMDHEIMLVPGQSFLSALPRVDFRLYSTQLVDTTLVRVEHIWAAPEASSISASGVEDVSNAHYWTVDGIWPEGTELRARLYYDANADQDLDVDLYGDTEAAAILLYRASGEDPWELCTDYTLVAGTLTNGTGYFDVDVLRKGHYAFANGNPFVGLADEQAASSGVQVHPNPAVDRIQLQAAGESGVQWTIRSMDGRICRRVVSTASVETVDITDLATATYLAQATDRKGQPLGVVVFDVVR